MRYWESLPTFFDEQFAKVLAAKVRDYFKIPASVVLVEDKDVAAFNLDGQGGRDSATWGVAFESKNENQKELIEAFIVGWGQGSEWGHIDERVGSAEKRRRKRLPNSPRSN